MAQQQLVEERLNAQQYIRIPLAESLLDQGINLIKRECGFPDNWSYIDIGAWLAEYDYIPFSRRQMERHDPEEVIGHYISTNYDADANRWRRDDIVWFNLPLQAFDMQMIEEICMLLINREFDVREYGDWVRYLLLGGPDRIRVGIRRYDTNIHLNHMFQNLNIQHLDN